MDRREIVKGMLMASAMQLVSGGELMAAEKKKNIVLVHGAWGDGSHWRKVIPLLVKNNFNVTAVQCPLESFEGDVAKTMSVLDAQDGDIILVGHSYGGCVISAAGNHKKVKGLVFVSAYAPLIDESAFELTSKGPPVPDNLFVPDTQGFLLLNKVIFPTAFCQDADHEDQLVMNAAQKPTHPNCLQAKLKSEPAWKTKPSWYAVSTNDNTIVSSLQEFMYKRINPIAIKNVNAGHASMISRPTDIAELIEEAALKA